MAADALILDGKSYSSRLLVGTGRYKDIAQTRAAVEASGAEIITVAVRRVDAASQAALWQALPPERYTYLPNTAGCRTAEEAVRLLRLAREAGAGKLVKLEVIGDERTLYPNEAETVRAAEILANDGFAVMAYTTDNPDVAKALESCGCAAVMPLAAPIGSGLGILNPDGIRQIVQALKVPVLVDAGIGTASEAAWAMELGCAGVLMNTAIAEAGDPVRMAGAMKHAVIAGREAFLAGRMPRREYAVASSPAA